MARFWKPEPSSAPSIRASATEASSVIGSNPCELIVSVTLGGVWLPETDRPSEEPPKASDPVPEMSRLFSLSGLPAAIVGTRGDESDAHARGSGPARNRDSTQTAARSGMRHHHAATKAPLPLRPPCQPPKRRPGTAPRAIEQPTAR